MNNPQTSSPQPGQAHSRRVHYIDHVVQKWMLIALVVLEVVVLSIAGAILYVRLNIIVDENLYRIHFAGQPSMFSVLLKESLLILGGLVAVNLAALFAADRIWARYVNSILVVLRELLSRTRDLDLQATREAPPRHKVVALALAWRGAERARHLDLKQALDVVEQTATQASAPAAEFRAGLLALREHLPEARALESSLAP